MASFGSLGVAAAGNANPNKSMEVGSSAEFFYTKVVVLISVSLECLLLYSVRDLLEEKIYC